MKRTLTAGECSNSMLDLSSLPAQENSIVSNRLHPIDTFSQLPKYVDGGSIDFHADASSIESISLLESFLYFEMQVVKFDADNHEKQLVVSDLVSYSPFIMNSLFKNISMKINDEEISQSAENYQAYEAYVNTVVQLSRTAQRNLLDGSALLLSKPGTGTVTDPNLVTPLGPANPGLQKRHGLAMESHTNGFVSPLIWAPFLVPRVLPTQTELSLSLKLNTSEFCLIVYKKDELPLPPYRIKILKAQLFLQKYRLSPQAQLHQERMLSSGAKYPMIINKTASFMIEKGSTQGFRALTIASELPRMCYVFMVSRDSLNSIQHSPYVFDTFGVRNMYLEADGEKYPSNLSYDPDFAKGRTIKNYMVAKKQLFNTNTDPFIDHEAFAGYYSIFPFNLVPDRSLGCDYISVPENKAGNLNLHVKFEKELSQAICVFVVMEFYKVLILDSQRKPTWL